MEAQAQTDSTARWAQGRSEELCFRAATFQAIFLSQVWHHLENSAQAACEFQRVLKPGGGLFIKTYSHAQLRERWDLTAVFPELLPFMLGIYPDTPELTSLLCDTGFKRVWHKSYRKDENLRPSALLHVAEEKLWSMFAYLSEEGRARGIAYLRRLIAETSDAPIPSAEVHLLVCAEK
jgi:ubiquinone/menaquinone biosynthesis C-methylase UbiE